MEGSGTVAVDGAGGFAGGAGLGFEKSSRTSVFIVSIWVHKYHLEGLYGGRGKRGRICSTI